MRRNASRVHYEDMLSAYKACKDIIEMELSKHSSWSHTNCLIIQANKWGFNGAAETLEHRRIWWETKEARKATGQIKGIEIQWDVVQ